MNRHTSNRRTHSWAIVLLALALSACAGPSETGARPSDMGHVHGLGLNPADNTLYVATHNGVYVVKGKGPRLIANRSQDTMGFTVTGADRFLASGHPADPSEPNPLGLIESTDRARTWTPIKFEGQLDLHSIDTAGAWTYAYSADRGLILGTKDLTSWTTVASGDFVDFAVNPAMPTSLLATTPSGELLVLQPGRRAETIDNAPALTYIDWSEDRVVAGIDRTGNVWASWTYGSTWTQLADLPGTPQAFSAEKDSWYAATSQGIYRSTDQGKSWTRIVKVA